MQEEISSNRKIVSVPPERIPQWEPPPPPPIKTNASKTFTNVLSMEEKLEKMRREQEREVEERKRRRGGR